MIIRRARLLVGIIGLAAAITVVHLVVFVRPLSVTVVAPESDLALGMFGLGTIEARVASQIGFSVGGTLRELVVDYGDTVTEGASLPPTADLGRSQRDSQNTAEEAKRDEEVAVAELAVASSEWIER